MTTLILLALLAYVWAVAVLILADDNDGWRYWDKIDWAAYIAFPLVWPVTASAFAYESHGAPIVKKVKAEAKRLYNWLTGRDQF